MYDDSSVKFSEFIDLLLEVEYKRIMLSCYFLRVGFETIFEEGLFEFIVELNILSFDGAISLCFNNGIAVLKEVPGRLCFIGILTILGFC
tara:strand:- start:770 stop:1039 length:270 start_codon:yes stop_codon:yes gene_type:complete